MSDKVKVAIVGSGNIGTDLLMKIVGGAQRMEMGMLVGIDPDSDGLARARGMGVDTTHEGVDGLLRAAAFQDIRIVFDATSAAAHRANAKALADSGVQLIDLTPAAIGPYVVPVVNLEERLDAPNINLVSCGGQATIPMVAAVNRVAPVHYAEIVASVSSRSAGPGTRANIDEFTRTTARGIERVGGATRGKAIIVLNPAEPPLMMRNTVFTLSDVADEREIVDSVDRMVAEVQSYVPGYRLKQTVQFEHYSAADPIHIPGHGDFSGTRASIFLEVEGAGQYLPAYAGNLDIMTSAALGAGERIAELKFLASPTPVERVA